MVQATELATVTRVEHALTKMKTQFQSSLPSHIPTNKFLRAAVSAVQNAPDIQECTVSTVISSCQKAAADGLVLDNREAALVSYNKNIAPYGQKAKYEKHAQYMPMVAGILKKARNSGQISTIAAYVVYQNDFFEYELGLNPKLVHKPIIDGDPGNLRCCYAIAHLKDGTTQFEVMTRPQVLKVQMASASGWDRQKNKPKGIWAKWEDEMWRKTVAKKLCKYLPSSSDLDGLIDYDNAEFGVDASYGDPSDKSVAAAATAEEPAAKKQTRAAAAILKEAPADGIRKNAVEGEVLEGELMDNAPPNDGSDQQNVDDLI